MIMACQPAAGSDSVFWEPYIGAGGAPADVTSVSSGSSGGSNTSSSGNAGNGGAGGAGGASIQFLFQFTTVSMNGKYAPKNVGAVWIADGSGAFVKTLEVWAAKRAEHLVKWNEVTGANIVDAVTGATRSSHSAHEVSWDGTNSAGVQVLPGDYHIDVEFTEWNSSESGKAPGPYVSIPFVFGSMQQDINPLDTTGFTAMHLVYAP